MQTCIYINQPGTLSNDDFLRLIFNGNKCNKDSSFLHMHVYSVCTYVYAV